MMGKFGWYPGRISAAVDLRRQVLEWQRLPGDYWSGKLRHFRVLENDSDRTASGLASLRPFAGGQNRERKLD